MDFPIYGYKPEMTLKDMERLLIEESLVFHRGNITLSAKRLGVGRATLYRKINEYGLRFLMRRGDA